MGKLSLGRATGGIAAISSGTAAGQAVTLLATPVLSRIYSPAAYGAYASLMAFVMMASTAGTLRLEAAVPISTAGDARHMLKASGWSSLIAGLICAGVVAGLGHSALSGEPWLGAVLVVYTVWVTALYVVLTAYSLRSHQYAAVARRNFLQATGTAGGQLALSRWLQSALGLTAGLAVGRTLGVGSLMRESRLLSSRQETVESSMSSALKRYWRFPLVFMPSALLNVLGTQLPILLVARAYGADSAGNLAQAITFGAIPAALLGTAISSVVLAEMAARVRAGELDQRQRYLRASKALAPLGFGWFVGLVLMAPIVLPLVLGPEWQSSGDFAAALAIGAGLGLVVSPLTVVLLLYERSALNLGLDAFRVVVVAGSGIASWKVGHPPVLCVLAMSVAMAIVYLMTWIVGLRTVTVRPPDLG